MFEKGEQGLGKGRERRMRLKIENVFIPPLMGAVSSSRVHAPAGLSARVEALRDAVLLIHRSHGSGDSGGVVFSRVLSC